MKNIRNDPKLYYIFAGSFMLLAVFTIVSGIFIISQLQKINEINEEVTEALLVSQLALDFNVENFHTQLEVWEYAYEPNALRLLAFQGHERKLVELSDRLLDIVKRDSLLEQGAGLVPGGDKEINKIISDLQLVREDWIGLFEAVGDFAEARDAGASREELDRLDAIALEAVIKNEDLFDALEFNREIDEFVQDQKDFFDKIYAQPEKIIARFTILLTILVTLLFVLGILMPVLLIFYGKKR